MAFSREEILEEFESVSWQYEYEIRMEQLASSALANNVRHATEWKRANRKRYNASTRRRYAELKAQGALPEKKRSPRTDADREYQRAWKAKHRDELCAKKRAKYAERAADVRVLALARYYANREAILARKRELYATRRKGNVS